MPSRGVRVKQWLSDLKKASEGQDSVFPGNTVDP